MSRDEIYYSSSNIIDRLIKTVVHYSITTTLLPEDECSDEYSIRELNINVRGAEFRCFIDNEYGDAERDNVPLHLNHVLSEFENYDDVDDYVVWTRQYGMDAGSVAVSALWDRLQDNQLRMRKIIGSDIQTAIGFDLDAEDAFYLRRLPRPMARPDLYPLKD